VNWHFRESEQWSNLSLVARAMVIGAATTGALGAISGLVIGLLDYAPTAWAAMFELGIPSALVGSIFGLVIGAIARATGAHR
jgi:hypothetical protein